MSKRNMKIKCLDNQRKRFESYEDKINPLKSTLKKLEVDDNQVYLAWPNHV